MTPQQKRIKTYITDNFTCDKITCKKDGTVVIRRSYFYKFGKTSQDWADKVKAALDSAQIPCTVKGEDEWAAWPKTSYWAAIVTPIEQVQA